MATQGVSIQGLLTLLPQLTPTHTHRHTRAVTSLNVQDDGRSRARIMPTMEDAGCTFAS